MSTENYSLVVILKYLVALHELMTLSSSIFFSECLSGFSDEYK